LFDFLVQINLRGMDVVFYDFYATQQKPEKQHPSAAQASI